jgi:predicted O-methyltransferase YrrM
MNTLQIGRARFSRFFWEIVDEKVSDYPYEAIEKIIKDQQRLREEADYNTGSLPYDDAVDLYKLIHFFQPHTIAEVGTFIGVSTNVMAKSLEDFSYRIYTCDSANDIEVNPTNKLIEQYPRCTSTDMFTDLAEKGVKIDLVYLDGRLSQSDAEPLSKIVHEKTVFVLDDFEGIEKGVANALMLEAPSRVLIYPREGRKTAASIPISLIQLVPQEAV